VQTITNPMPRVKEIICEVLDIDQSQLTETSLFKEELGADSLQAFEIFAALEHELGIEIPTDEANKMVNLVNIARYLETTQGVS
jgi:acyl carrier protein